ncbi:MAG: response regulator [Candidatus Omnitrophica bacterium]|nr:response regulator [Candidatus Omnitrophota bacterium]
MPRILVVDDEPRIADIIEKYLSLNGFEVIKTIGGEKALEFLESGAKIDLMCLDMRMPKVDGRDIIQKTKEMDKKVPIILLTGSIDAQISLEALKDAGFTEADVLYKPVDLPVLLEKIRRKLAAV